MSDDVGGEAQSAVAVRDIPGRMRMNYGKRPAKHDQPNAKKAEEKFPWLSHMNEGPVFAKHSLSINAARSEALAESQKPRTVSLAAPS